MSDAKPPEESTVPFEALPMLAADPEFIASAERLRELQAILDDFYAPGSPFEEPDKKKGTLGGEYYILRLDVSSRASVAGVKGLLYHDLRVLNTAGRVVKGKVTGAGLLDYFGVLLSVEQLRAVALAAVDLDPQILMDNGISPAAISHARSADSRSAGSIRVDIVKPKGGA